MTTTTAPTSPSTTAVVHPPEAGVALQRKILSIIEKQSFATLATTSAAGHPHVAGVVYESVDSTLWVHTLGQSRKARNIDSSGKAAICIAFRRLPAGPPFTIHFQAHAETVAMDDARVLELLDAGKLKSISGHGALDMADGRFVAIQPKGTIHSFGPGARTLDIIRDPLNSGARNFSVDS